MQLHDPEAELSMEDNPEAELTAEDTTDTLPVDETVVDQVEPEIGRDGNKERDVGTEIETAEPKESAFAPAFTPDGDSESYVPDDKASGETDCPTTQRTALRTENNDADGPSSPHCLPTPTSCPTPPNTIASGGLSPLAITGPSLQLSLPCPTLPLSPSPPSASTVTLSTEMNGNSFTFQQAGPPGFLFPEESGTPVQGSSTFDPYSCNFGFMTNNWSVTPPHLATPSLNPSTGFWFGNGENYPSGLAFSQGAPRRLLYYVTLVYLSFIPDTKTYPQGGFLCALYEPLDPSLVPSNHYPLPGRFVEIR